MYRATAHQSSPYHPYPTAYGHGPTTPWSGNEIGRGGGSGYAPVNPFKASIALGIKKVFQRAEDRTIDDIPVEGMVGGPLTGTPYPEPYGYRSPSRRGYTSSPSPTEYQPHDRYRPPSREWQRSTRSHHRHRVHPERPDGPGIYPSKSPELGHGYDSPARRRRSYSPSGSSRSRGRVDRSRSRGMSRSRSRWPYLEDHLARPHSPAPHYYELGPPVELLPPSMQPPIARMPQPVIPSGVRFGPHQPAPISNARPERPSRRRRSRSPRREPIGIVRQPPPTQQLPPVMVTGQPPNAAPVIPMQEAPVIPVIVSPRSRSHSPSSPAIPQVHAVTVPPIAPAHPSSPAHMVIQQPQIHNYTHSIRRSRSPSPVRRKPSPPRPVLPESLQPIVIKRERSHSRWLPRRSGSFPRSESGKRSVSPSRRDPVYVPPATSFYRPSPRRRGESNWWRGGDIHPVFPMNGYYPPVPGLHHSGYPLPGPQRQSHYYAGGMSVDATWFTMALSLLLDVIPRQIYLHFLLRFPSLYFSRVTRIFQDANLGMGEIKRMALEAIELDKAHEGVNKKLLYQGVFPQDWRSGAETQPLSYINLRNSWQAFIDSLMREWKTLNIISVLLLSAILTILQIETAASNPLTRFSALLSLICAFMSLIYGCLYIIRFGTMRKTHKAAEWANESEKTSTSIFWNVWVMLSMPAVWLGWSMIFYIICIMSFVWQTGTVSQPHDYLSTDLEILIPRIVISCILALGFIYLILVGVTFSQYSDPMEQAWQARIRGWLAEKTGTMSGYYRPFSYPEGRQPGTSQRGRSYEPKYSRSIGYPNSTPLNHTKTGNVDGYQVPQVRPVGQGASSPLRRNSARAQYQSNSRSMPKAATNPRSIPLSQPVTRKAGGAFVDVLEADAEKVEKGVKMVSEPHANPFVSGFGAPGMLKREAGSVSTNRSTPTPLSDSIELRDHVSALQTGRVGQELVKGATENPTQVAIPDSEHPRQSRSAKQEEASENCVAKVLAVPLKDASTVDDKSPALEEMQEVYKFDLRDKEVQNSKGSVVRDDLSGLAASTSRISGNIPIPRELLERGLAYSIWKRFCEEIFSASIGVVGGKAQALAKMVEVVDAWNGHLEPFDMFLALIQFDDTVEEDVPTACYSLYLGPKGLARVGVRTVGSNTRPSRLTLKGHRAKFQVHKSGYPEMLGILGRHDGVLKFSGDERDHDEEQPTEEGR